MTRFQEPSAKKFHLSVGGGLRVAGPAAGKITDAFNNSGFGGTVGGWFGPVTYPTDHGTPVYWNLSGEYSITDNLRLGLSWSSNPTNEIGGRDRESENTHAQSYALICTYVPSPVDPSFAARSEFGITAGFSYNVMNVGGSISTYSYSGVNQSPTVISQANNTLGFLLRLLYLAFALIWVPFIIATPLIYDRRGNFFEQFSLVSGALIAFAQPQKSNPKLRPGSSWITSI